MGCIFGGVVFSVLWVTIPSFFAEVHFGINTRTDQLELRFYFFESRKSEESQMRLIKIEQL